METSMPSMANSPSLIRHRLQERPFRNWVASVLMLDVARIELLKFTKSEMNNFFQDIWRGKNPIGDLCDGCKTKSPSRCAVEYCPVSKVKDEIRKVYRSGRPMFRNIDPRECLTDSWALAKCYMSNGYEGVKTAEETDFSGLLNVIINNVLCAKKIVSKQNPGDEKSVFREAREVRNSTMHASPMEITDKCLQNNKKVLVKMLNSLLSTKANDAIDDIEKLESDDMSETDAVSAFKQSLEALTKFKGELTKSIPKIKADLEKMDANGTSSIDEMETTSTAVEENTIEQNEQVAKAKYRKKDTITRLKSDLTELGTTGERTIDNVETAGTTLINTYAIKENYNTFTKKHANYVRRTEKIVKQSDCSNPKIRPKKRRL